MDQFSDSWYSYQFRYCSVNNSGEIKKLDPEDTLQLVLEAKDDEAKDFFELIGDFLLQQKQKSVIKGNLF